MKREAFLKRVRQAAEAGRAHRVKTRDLPGDVAYVGADSDRCAALASDIVAVGGVPRIVGSHQQARGIVSEWLELEACRSALCWQHPVLQRCAITELLQERSVDQHSYDSLASCQAHERRERMLAADVGITGVDCAVAETGTLAVFSQAGRERLASLLPPCHIAIVEESQIVPDLFDAFGQLSSLEQASLPSNVAFITGPSKTGDIELQLTTGVHGPGKWYVLIIRGA